MAAGELQAEKLRIAHVFRAPLGGLFRHVVDLAIEQAARGHEVGVFFDSGGLCERVDEALARIPGGLALGVGTCPIHRNPGVHDVFAFARFSAWLRQARPDVVHGHGSKGGVYARLSALSGTPGAPIRAYTPHGGSFNYRPGSWPHRLYMGVERIVASSTDVFLFESAYIAGRFDQYVGVREGCAPNRSQRPRRSGIRSRRAQRRRRRPALCRGAARGQGHRHAARGLAPGGARSRRAASSDLGRLGSGSSHPDGAGPAPGRRRSRELSRPDADSTCVQTRTNPGRAFAGRIDALRRTGGGRRARAHGRDRRRRHSGNLRPLRGSSRPLRQPRGSRPPHRAPCSTCRLSCVGGRRRISHPTSPRISISNRWSTP